MKYEYPAIISKIDDNDFKYDVYFVDFYTHTNGVDFDDAMYMASDCLKALVNMYNEINQSLPTPTNPTEVIAETPDAKVYVISAEA